MPSQLFAGEILCGAGVLALWVSVRFPSLAPRSARGIGLRMLLAVASLAATMPAFGAARAMMDPPAALVLVTLPSAVVLLLALGWLFVWVVRGTPERLR